MQSRHSIKIMASGPITSWQINGETRERVTDFIFLGSKITADGDCSHANKRRLLLGRKAMTNLDSPLKSRDITLLTNVHIVKAMVFPVVMYRCKSWIIKMAKCLRIHALGLTGLILQSRRVSRVFSSTAVQKHQFFGAQLSLRSNSPIYT